MSAISDNGNSFAEHFVEGKHLQVSYQDVTVGGIVWSHASEAGLLVMRTQRMDCLESLVYVKESLDDDFF